MLLFVVCAVWSSVEALTGERSRAAAVTSSFHHPREGGDDSFPQWAALLDRAGAAECRELVHRFKSDEHLTSGDLERPWWQPRAGGFRETAACKRERTALLDAAWADVGSALGNRRANDKAVAVAARNATELLATWAAHDPEGARFKLSRGVAVLAYISRTPFGGDEACVAAALLCEAHESADGLELELVRDRCGEDAAALVRSLCNLEQLYALQRARWDAAEASQAQSQLEQVDEAVASSSSSQEARVLEEDALLAPLYRLPATHASNLRQMLVAVAGDFRALPLLLARKLEALHDEVLQQRTSEACEALEWCARHAGATLADYEALLESGGGGGGGGGGAAETIKRAPVRPSSLARDALDVLAPLAERFGLYALKSDLEDAAFERLAPRARQRVVRALDLQRDERAVVLEDVSKQLKRLMFEDDVLMNAVEHIRVSTREKEPYSVWRKQRKLRTRDGTDESRVLTPLDTLALRVVLEPKRLELTASDVEAAAATRVAQGQVLCYHALALVRKSWPALARRDKDYIQAPKPNGYQSLHSTLVMRLHGVTHPFEVQIRTHDMHLVAEFGSAAHALYHASPQADLLEHLTKQRTSAAQRESIGDATHGGADRGDVSETETLDASSSQSARHDVGTRHATHATTHHADDLCGADAADNASSLENSSARDRDDAEEKRAVPEAASDEDDTTTPHAPPLASSSSSSSSRSSPASSSSPPSPSSSVSSASPVTGAVAAKARRAAPESSVRSYNPARSALAAVARGAGTVMSSLGVDDESAELLAAATGAALGESLGAQLRESKVFVLASGGRVLTVGTRSNAVDVRKQLLRDLEADAPKGEHDEGAHKRPGGKLQINGRPVEWLASLSTNLLNGDEVRWAADEVHERS